MKTDSVSVRHNRPTNDELHPFVYRAIIGLTIWLVLSIWFFFSRGAYAGLDAGVITFFFFVLVGIPVLIWLSWRHNTNPDERHTYDASYREWTSHAFATWTGGISGREAAAQILLPIAAVAIGMSIFGLVFLFAVPHVS